MAGEEASARQGTGMSLLGCKDDDDKLKTQPTGKIGFRGDSSL